MKLFFISDIHGSLYYLNQALEKFKEENADYLVILGDELYHGARNPLPTEYNPKEVANLLNQYATKIIAIRGNCDSEVDAMVLKYPVLADFSTVFWQGKRLFLTHGHLFDETHMPPLSEGDVFLYGHTHVPKAEKQNGITVINPGSITFPKENSPHTYGVLENDLFLIKDMSGTIYKQVTLLTRR